MTCRHDEIWFLMNVFHLTNLATTTIQHHRRAMLPRLQISVVRIKYTQFFDVDINECRNILKGVGALLWTFYDQVVKVEKEWVEQEFELLIIAALPNETGLPNQ